LVFAAVRSDPLLAEIADHLREISGGEVREIVAVGDLLRDLRLGSRGRDGGLVHLDGSLCVLAGGHLDHRGLGGVLLGSGVGGGGLLALLLRHGVAKGKGHRPGGLSWWI